MMRARHAIFYDKGCPTVLDTCTDIEAGRSSLFTLFPAVLERLLAVAAVRAS